ncbi:MAG: hypothetical protein JNM36_02585 [Chitinophagales bacterium]|jgi:hypothetical protein|nr:hypothetical protein [Chitinophagales bacterium]
MKTLTIEVQEEQYTTLLQFLQTLPYICIPPTNQSTITHTPTLTEEFAPLTGVFDFWISEEEDMYQTHLDQ